MTDSYSRAPAGGDTPKSFAQRCQDAKDEKDELELRGRVIGLQAQLAALDADLDDLAAAEKAAEKKASSAMLARVLDEARAERAAAAMVRQPPPQVPWQTGHIISDAPAGPAVSTGAVEFRPDPFSAPIYPDRR